MAKLPFDKISPSTKRTFKDPYCAPSTRLLHYQAFYDKYDKAPSRSFKTDNILVSQLIEDFGKEEAQKFILDVVKRWEDIKERLKNIYGLPTLKTIYGLRFALMDALERKNSVEYKSVTYNGTKPKSKKTKDANKKVPYQRIFSSR